MTANSVVNQIFQSESFVLQKGLNCPKSTIQGVGTPESLFLYQIHNSMQLVHQTAFPCTKPTTQGGWYTRKPFPVQNPRFKAIGTPDGLSLYKPTIQGVGTPDGLFLFQTHDSMQLVHQKAFSCTNSMIQCSWYTGKPFPVPNPRFNAVGTPESLSLYQIHDSRQLVHQKAFSCTKSNHQIE